jgi:parallel beta-helix repeat protein
MGGRLGAPELGEVLVLRAVTFRSLLAFIVCATIVVGLASSQVAQARSSVAGSSPFLITRNGNTYQARSQTTGTTYTGTLKFVMESAADLLNRGGGGTVTFAAGTFDFGSQYFKLYDLHNITFEGQGIDVTVLRNSSSAAADTEPFNFSGTFGVVVRDMTVSAGGPLRTTSDALDFDFGNDSTVERVKVIASRGRAIVFDGKDAGWHSANNVVRDCVITGGVQSDGIEFLASTNNLVEGCTISNTGGHGIQAAKSSTGAPQPNKTSSDNIIRNNVIDNAGQDGINVNGGDRNRIEGNRVTNSANIAANKDGIRIGTTDSVSCNDTVVENNTATDNQATKTQRYGLFIASSLCNRTVVGTNDFSGNRTGAIRDLGTNTQYTGPPPPPPPPPSSGGFTFNPTADSYVTEASPTTNYGTSTQVRADGSPIVRAYLRFDVQGVAGTVTSAKLRIYANSASSVGHEVRRVADTGWGETTITFSNAPNVDAPTGTSGPFSAGGYVEVDVSSLITGNGTYSLAVTTPHTTAISYASRESTNAPVLVVKVL